MSNRLYRDKLYGFIQRIDKNDPHKHSTIFNIYLSSLRNDAVKNILYDKYVDLGRDGVDFNKTIDDMLGLL